MNNNKTSYKTNNHHPNRNRVNSYLTIYLIYGSIFLLTFNNTFQLSYLQIFLWEILDTSWTDDPLGLTIHSQLALVYPMSVLGWWPYSTFSSRIKIQLSFSKVIPPPCYLSHEWPFLCAKRTRECCWIWL